MSAPCWSASRRAILMAPLAHSEPSVATSRQSFVALVVAKVTSDSVSWELMLMVMGQILRRLHPCRSWRALSWDITSACRPQESREEGGGAVGRTPSIVPGKARRVAAPDIAGGLLNVRPP